MPRAVMHGIRTLLNAARTVLARTLQHHETSNVEEKHSMGRLNKKHVKNARALLDYALGEGVAEVNDRLVQDINQAEEVYNSNSSVSVKQRVEFEKAYRDIAKVLTPVTAESLRMSFVTIRNITWFIMGIFIILIIFVIFYLPSLNVIMIFLIGLLSSFILWFIDVFTGIVSKKRLIQIILFCYLFTIISILSSILLPVLLVLEQNIYAKMLLSPIGIVKGCSKQIKNDWIPEELRCQSQGNDQRLAKISQWVFNIGGDTQQLAEPNPEGQEGADRSDQTRPNEETPADTSQNQTDPSAPTLQRHNPVLPVVEIRGGLVVPLYVVVISLMGGAVSLTRRVPEYQKRIGTDLRNPQRDLMI
jgi:hypothetical protein